MSISEIGTIFGISLAVASGAGSAGKLYLDTQYVSSDTIIELELRQLKRERRKLERLENPTPEQQWLIDDLNDEIEDLQRELDG